MSPDIKKRYWQKKWDNAPIIKCGCGCDSDLKSMDRYGRPVIYINGHNGRKYEVNGNPKTAAYKRWKAKNRLSFNTGKTRRYRKRKLKLMTIFGNCCEQCGLAYNGKNAALFEFRHENPAIKDGIISVMLRNTTFDNVLVEAEKCKMLCAHCHILTHNEAW